MKAQIKTIITVSAFWITVAGVIVLCMTIQKNALAQGRIEGIQSAKTLCQQ